MRECYLIDAIRTARGRLSRPKKGIVGELSKTHPVTMGAILANAILERNPQLPPEKIEDLIYSTTIAVDEQGTDLARWIVLASRLPESVSGILVNRYCSGALQANAFANASVKAGDYDVVLAGGGENMNICPMGSNRANPDRLPITPEITTKYDIVSQGVAAENVAEKYGIGQDEINRFSVQSQQKAHAATEAGRFKNEIIPITWHNQDGEPQILDRDTHINPDTTAEKINNLPRPFRENGVIHAAAASGICDGAAMALWVSGEIADTYGLKPRARVLANSNFGVNPTIMLDGVIPGTELALKRAGLTIDQIDRFEINEAFASVPLAWMKALKVPEEKVNVNGGAIAMGHPLGSTGGILLATMINELERENLRYGLISLCAANGMAGTMIIEHIPS